MIYADNAATTQLNKTAYEAMLPWLLDIYGNASQPYSFARKPKKALAEARATIAKCINALPEEIFFTSGGTEGDNWAIKGAVFTDEVKRSTITSKLEHAAVLHSCKAIEQLGYPVDYLNPTANGVITVDTLRNMISHTTRLVSVMYANNEIGTIQPIKELCDLTHSQGALFHTDAVQAVGHVEIDVKQLGVDMLTSSAHKFNGPKGVGFQYIRKGTKILPYVNGGAQESQMRAGTENIAAVVGMARALEENCSALEENVVHNQELERQLITALRVAHIPFTCNGGNNTLPGLVSLSFAGEDGETILHRMDLMGICISTGSACHGKNTDISHVLQAINLDRMLAKGTVRISLGKNNTLKDVDAIVNALIRIIK